MTNWRNQPFKRHTDVLSLPSRLLAGTLGVLIDRHATKNSWLHFYVCLCLLAPVQRVSVDGSTPCITSRRSTMSSHSNIRDQVWISTAEPKTNWHLTTLPHSASTQPWLIHWNSGTDCWHQNTPSYPHHTQKSKVFHLHCCRQESVSVKPCLCFFFFFF